MDCIFCKIILGSLPSYTIYEDSLFLAFLDIRPLNPGHVLVIPKKHYCWVWDVPNIGEYYELVNKIANVLRKVMKTEQIVSLVLGEEVHHAHVWLVPRFDQDGHGGGIDLKNIKSISDEEMHNIQEKIRSVLRVQSTSRVKKELY